jgi:hypothetical protein
MAGRLVSRPENLRAISEFWRDVRQGVRVRDWPWPIQTSTTQPHARQSSPEGSHPKEPMRCKVNGKARESALGCKVNGKARESALGCKVNGKARESALGCKVNGEARERALGCKVNRACEREGALGCCTPCQGHAIDYWVRLVLASWGGSDSTRICGTGY